MKTSTSIYFPCIIILEHFIQKYYCPATLKSFYCVFDELCYIDHKTQIYLEYSIFEKNANCRNWFTKKESGINKIPVYRSKPFKLNKKELEFLKSNERIK